MKELEYAFWGFVIIMTIVTFVDLGIKTYKSHKKMKERESNKNKG